MNVLRRISNYYTRFAEKIRVLKQDSRLEKISPQLKKNTLLILRLDSIGDYILFRNFIDTLKKSDKYKSYHVTLCGNSWWKELSESLDKEFVHEFIWVDYGRMQDFNYSNSVFNQIHSKGFEVLIHPTYSRDNVSDKIVRLSGAKEKMGYDGDLINLSKLQKEKNDKAYTRLIPSKKKYEFEFFRNRDFFEQVLDLKILIKRPEIHSIGKSETKIIICPGAKDAFRRWSPLNFAALCDKLKLDFPTQEFVICGSDADGIFAKQIIEYSNVNFTDSTGKLSLNELVDVFSKAKLIVTNDSGPFHIATALQKNVFCISNANNYGRFTPYPEEMETKATVIFPPELLKIKEESERLEKFCKHGSQLDINSIGVLDVYERIKSRSL